MHDTNDANYLKAEARQELARIRRSVHTAPAPKSDGAPTWLHEIEHMRDFFNSAAVVWDKVFGTDAVDPLYRAVAAQIAQTEAAIRILVLGCGTGLELNDIFARVPNARISGIDLAAGMLAELRKKFRTRLSQIDLIEASYVDLPLGGQRYDYVVATLTVHHLPPETKLDLYRRIRTALKLNGCYVEGDQSTSPRREQEILHWYQAYIATLPGGDKGEWNYDVTLSAETTERLLREAGFSTVELTWEQRDESGHGLAVLVASNRAKG